MKKSAPIRCRSVVEEIEPRILYSADVSPGLLAAAPLAPPAEHRTLDGGGEFTQQSTQVAQTVRHEVVFVDTAVPDYQKLVDDITANSDTQHQYDVVLLRSGADGIKQISETLVGMRDVSAVHIISHGSDGQVQLGDATLNFDSLLKNASEIKGWGQALASGADLLIYGCDVAEYADGKALMNALSRLTGADVAASTDATGAAALGGNWDLEYRTGATITPFAEPGWNGVLATQTLDWDAQTWAGGSVGPHSYAVGGGNVTVTIQPNFSAPTQFTNGTPELNTNNQGGLPVAENGLNIGTNGFQPGEEAVITIGFSHPGGVSNVSFAIFDIDTGGGGGFIDEVQAGYTASGPVTLTITPSADNTLVAPDTVRGTSQGSQNGPNSGDANATFSFAGSGITQITLHYRNVGNSNNEAITLHDITFDDNAPPVLATGSVLGYAENQAATAINTTITVSDADDATLASATVSITGNFTSGEDVLGFVNNPATMGNIAGAYNALTGVMTLNSAGSTATLANWQAALRAVTYLDSSNNPSTAARTISYVVNDGAANSNTVTSTVNITAVNDAPALAGASVLAYSENQAATAINTAITVSDADNATLASATVSITGNFASGEDVLGFVNGVGMGNIAGAYNALTGVMTLNSAGSTATLANWQTALRAVTYLDSSNNPSTLARTVSYTVGDGAANSNTLASTVNITAVNDAPTLSGVPATYAGTEQTTLNLAGTGITVGDVDGGPPGSEKLTLSVVSGVLNATAGGSGAGVAGSGTNTLTLTGTIAQLNSLLSGGGGATLTYINNSNTPPASDTLSLSLNDNGNTGSGGAKSANASSTINISAVNDVPTAAAPVSYAGVEQTLLDLTNSGLVVGDVDALGAGETVTLSVVSGVLNATAGGTGAGVAGSGSNMLTLSGTIAQLNNLLTGGAGATLSYINNSDTPPATDTLTLAVDDNGNSGSGGAQTANAISTININAVNDAPTLVIPGAQATGMNAPIIFSGANLISAGDVDGGAFSEQLTLSVTQGTLDLSGTAGLTLIGGANGSASMTYQGTLANLNAALNGLTYTPTVNYSGADTLSVASDDLGNSGGGGALGANGTVNLTVQANQAPTLSATPNNPPFTEAAGLGTQAPAVNVFSAANAGTVEAGQNTIGLSFTVGGLLDGASECIVVDGSAITLGANSAGVTATNAMSYTVNIVAGTATVTLSKPAGVSAPNINALINGITYQNTNTDNPSAGNRVFSLSQIQDSGGTANGGQDTTALATTSTVNVMPVNDAPLLANDSLAIVKGGSVVLSSTNLSATDIDSPAVGLTFSVSNVLDGQFELVSTPGVAITSFTQGAIVGGQVRFVHDGSISPPAFDLTVSDGTLSAGPTSATIVFSVPAGAPIIAPPAPTPPAPSSNAGDTPPAPPPSSQTKPAQPVVTPVVTLSGGLPMVPEPVGIELYEPIRGANPYLQVDARPPKANLNSAPFIKPAEQTLLIAGTDPQYMEFGPLTKIDWSAQTAFPSADHNPSEHDQITVIMESVRMGGIALSVGVVWWASRVTGLIGSLLASMPAWRQLDPLPIVGRDEEEDRWDETEDSEADADELAISMVLEGPRSRDPVSA